MPMGWQLRHNSDGDSEEKVIDLGEFLIVGINRSYQNLSDERLEYLNRELRDGRPVIVATHVPFYSEEDAESLEARSMEIRNRIYYWNKTDSVYSPDEILRNLLMKCMPRVRMWCRFWRHTCMLPGTERQPKKWGSIFLPPHTAEALELYM